MVLTPNYMKLHLIRLIKSLFSLLVNLKFLCSFLLVLVLTFCEVQEVVAQKNQNIFLVDYATTLMGTDSKKSLSNGNTYPAIATPFGMNFWTPMTAAMGNGWTYNYDDNKIRGIKQTHQPSPWLNDYAAFSLIAVTGNLKYQEDKRASWFSHKAETAKP